MSKGALLLHVEGEELDGVYDAIDFVKKTKSEAVIRQNLLGKRVAVIGAGILRLMVLRVPCAWGLKMFKFYTVVHEEEMTAYDFEFEFAKQDGVEFRWLTAPIELLEMKMEGKPGLNV